MTTVCIAGMHRSGTSMVARMLNLCGLYLGPEQDLIPPAPDNPEGFWENVRFVEINERILSAFGGAWDLPPSLPSNWVESGKLRPLREDAMRLIAEFSLQPVWGWKDPRSSLVLPFWRELIPDLKVLAVIRNPLDVFGSLTNRSHSSLAFSGRLIAAYNGSLLKDSYPEKRLITHYEAFFRSPKEEIQRLLVFLGISTTAEMIDKAASGAIPGLRHGQSSLVDARWAGLPSELLDEYVGLCRLAGPQYEASLAQELGELVDMPTLEHQHPGQKQAQRDVEPPLTSIDVTSGIPGTDELMGRQGLELSRLKREVAEKNQRLELLSTRVFEQDQKLAALSKQLSEQEQTMAALSTLAAEKDQAVQSLTRLLDEKSRIAQQQRDENQRLRQGLAFTQAELLELRSGLAFAFLSRYRALVERILPTSSPLRRLYSRVLRFPHILLPEGPRVVGERTGSYRTRNNDRAPRTSPTTTEIPPARQYGGTASPPRPGASSDDYATAYAQSVSVAADLPDESYVPFGAPSGLPAPFPVKAIAFYLPQFHPIPENDAWWGKGFTEWTNVSKAVPQFVGHYQPRLPAELGFYDLRIPEVQRRQIELAKTYGIHGFCIHYYWFNGKRLLDAPLDQFVNIPGNDFPFCLCWANENWTRRWDGREHDVLIAQTHSPESDMAFIRDVVPYFRRDNYIRVGDRPILIVYRLPLMPEPRATADRWRQYCRDAGAGDPYLVAAQTFGFVEDPRSYGFDAAVEFPPHDISAPRLNRAVQMLNRAFAGEVHSYTAAVEFMRNRHADGFPLFKTVFPGWDNEARKPGRGHIFAYSTPYAYRDWLVEAGRRVMDTWPPDDRLLFINAWNEWGEGAYLEPDRKYGYAYLQATADALTILAGRTPSQPPLLADSTSADAPVTLAGAAAPRSPSIAPTPIAPARISLDPVIVYQMGKVGSRSVVFSIERAFSSLRLPVEVFHVHNLSQLDDIEAVVRTRPDPTETLEAIRRDRLLRQRIDSAHWQPWKVISLVREPVSRNIAWFFQNLHELLPDWEERLRRNALSLDELQGLFLDTRQGTHDTAERWFDEQMKPVFGIDVFDRPFPTQVGHQRFSNPPRFELLLIRTEDLSACGPLAIGEFLGLPEFTLIDRNVSTDKPYAVLYNEFKRMPLPRSYIEEIYSGRFARHFYSTAELEEFMLRWTADQPRT